MAQDDIIRCFNCHAPALPEDNFCPNCGVRLASGVVKDLGAADRPDWQRVAAPPAPEPTSPGGLAPDVLSHSAPPPPGYPRPPAPEPPAPATATPVDMLPPPPAYFAPASYSMIAADDQERFLAGFSWGPGCGLYFWSRAMQWFLLGLLALRLYSVILEGQMGQLKPDDPAWIGVGLQGLLLIGLIFGLLIWAGRVGRRRRWAILRWRDFEHFRKDEQSWQPYGIVGWIIVGLSLLVGLFSGQ